MATRNDMVVDLIGHMDNPSLHANARILIVDDEPRQRESMTELVIQGGYDLLTAVNGQEALELLSREPIDLILLDLRMPELDGHEVMEYLKQQDLDTRVIVVSGDPSLEDAVKSLRHGVDNFIRKPFAVDELFEAIEKSLEKRSMDRQSTSLNRKLHNSEKLHRFIFKWSPDLMFLVDGQGRFRMLNDAFSRVLGYSSTDLVNKHWSVLVHKEDVVRVKHAFEERRTSTRGIPGVEFRLKCNPLSPMHAGPQPRSILVELRATGVYSQKKGKKAFLGTYGVARDITERKKVEELLTYQASHDILTGLPNRAILLDRLSLAITQARRAKTHLSVMYIDLDEFKFVNDMYGHGIGDRLLQMVSARLKESIRKGDTLSRMSGDEFVLLLPDIESEQAAAMIADKIRESMEETFVVDSHDLRVTCSIGIALFPDDGSEPEELLRKADATMYRVKKRGRHGFALYADSNFVQDGK